MATLIHLGTLSLLLVCYLAAAAPTASNPSASWKGTLSGDSTKASSGFSIRQVKAPNSTPQLTDIMDLTANTFRKYKAPIPDHLHGRGALEGLALDERQSFNLASYFTDGEYTVPIQVGTPAQTLYVVLDTGSSDLWVFSSGMPTSESSGLTIYSPAKSSSAQFISGQSWNIGYADGYVSGNVYNDELGIGPISVAGYPLEVALDASSSIYSATNTSGIWGVDTNMWQSQVPNIQANWLLLGEYFFNITLFTISFVYYGAGTVTFGAIDSTQHTGSIYYSPIVPIDTFWSVNTTSFSIGTGASTTLSTAAVLDTGTTLTYLPDSLCSAYWAQVSGSSLSSGTYLFPCNAALPDLHLKLLGGATMTFHGQYLNPYGFVAATTETGQICIGGLQSDTGIGFSVIGLAIFQSMFVVMDLEGSRVGFGTKTLLD